MADQYYQCYYRDSGMIFRQRKIEEYVPPDPLPDDYVEPEPEVMVPYEDRAWFDPAIHAAITVEKEFPGDWERRPYFFVPGLEVIDSNVDDDGRKIHPLMKILKAQFSDKNSWESLEDKIEASGGLRRTIERMDIGRLGRRVRRMRLAGDITANQAQKIKDVFQHLTSDFD